jgi:hypothetical protein
MRKKTIYSLLLSSAVCALAIFGERREHPASYAKGTLPQAAYLWQRQWTPAVLDSIAEQSGCFERLVVLTAEVSWQGTGPILTRVPLDYSVLSRSAISIGLALRVGLPGKGWADNRQIPTFLAKLAASLVKEARAHGVSPVELQLDFDCPEGKLSVFRDWLRMIKPRIAPTPLSLTALPCWLERSEFAEVLAEADEYVLQVHALERPRRFADSVSLCTVENVGPWVEQAVRLGVPFRVALPTYSYVLIFDKTGGFVGVTAEGPPAGGAENGTRKILRANPADAAAWVRAWTANRPTLLKGLIWFRLPVADDHFNWSPATFAAVCAGRTPAACLSVKTVAADDGLTEIRLANTGDDESASPVSVNVRFSQEQFVAGDALNEFQWEETGMGKLRLTGNGLRPGEEQVIAWLRFQNLKKAFVYVETANR